jgi:O-antigen/teichoic acid export membrane protein
MSDAEESDSSSFLDEIIGHSSIVLLGRVTELGIKFTATVLLARYLGQTGFGSISLALSVMMVGSTLSMAGLNSGVARFLPRYETLTQKGQVVSTATKIVILLSGLVAGAIYTGSYVYNFGLRSEDLEVIRVLAAAIPLFALVKLLWGVFQGEKLSDNYIITKSILFPIFRLSFLAIAAIVGMGVLGLAYAQVLAYASVIIIGVYLLIRDAKTILLNSITFEFSKARELLAFSSPLVLAGAMNMIYSQTDTILLGVLSTTSEVGTYNVVYPLAMLMFVVQSSLGFIFLPLLSEKHVSGIGKEVKESYRQIVQFTAVLTFPVYLLLIYQPDLVLSTIFGKQYASGAAALTVLTVGFYGRAILGPNNPALRAIGRTKWIMYLDSIAALLNVLLNVALISKFGLLGAAIATAISYLVLGTLYSTILYRITGIHQVSRQTVSIVGFSVLFPIALRVISGTTAFDDSPISAVIITIGVVVVYFAVLRLSGLFNLKNLLTDAIRNVRNDDDG